MKKEMLIKSYGKLYSGCEVEKGIFDYNILLSLYGGYLQSFFNSETSVYGNIAFLEHVIDGFEYYQDLLVGKTDLDDAIISDRMMKYDSEVRDKVDSSLYTQQDFIYTFSMKLPICFLEIGRDDLALSYGKKAIQNCYRIIDTTEEKECDKNGLEYWKHRN